MTDTQLFFAIGIPMVTIFASMVISLVQISGIREDMRAMRPEFREELRSLENRLDNRLAGIQSDLKEFYKLLNDHDRRMSKLEDK